MKGRAQREPELEDGRPAGESVQANNERWWSANPMTYDWDGTSDLEPLSAEWFADIDERFVDASTPYLTDKVPFDRIMPSDLSGKRVLEVGCGMGSHTAALLDRGGEVTAIDITDFAVEATQRRLELSGRTADVRRADAESLPFESGQFDFVWSWGVIHHSSCTTRIVREIARVLNPAGEARVMVYNRESFVARYSLLRHHVLGGGFRRRSPDETLWEKSDGHVARHYHREQLTDLFKGFFRDASTDVLGQEPDAVPLPGALRRIVAPLVTDGWRLRMAAKRGSFLFVTASQPF